MIFCKKTTDIRLRDPFVLAEGGIYYLYGTNVEEEGKLRVYKSPDLKNWSDGTVCFETVEEYGFNALWAPEVHKYNGRYYMFVTTKPNLKHRGTYVLVSDNAEGPFLLHSEGDLTPEEWECLDGTLYVDKFGKPYMIFCHEWIQSGNGEICFVELSKDLKKSVGEPKLMFKALDNKYVRETCAGTYSGFVTDGPFIYDAPDGTMFMTWSSMGEDSIYFVAQAKSDGGVDGTWHHDLPLVTDSDCGHGMIFKNFEGQEYLSLHCGNSSGKEYPAFIKIKYENRIILCEK